MKHFIFAVWLVAIAAVGQAQIEPDATELDQVALRHAEERERIRQVRMREQARFLAQEVACYARFAVNNCLAEVRSQQRELLGDLRRQEVSLNDALRKRRAADQILRSDERSLRAP